MKDGRNRTGSEQEQCPVYDYDNNNADYDNSNNND
jgi:hypothetical protein